MIAKGILPKANLRAACYSAAAFFVYIKFERELIIRELHLIQLESGLARMAFE